MIKRMYKWVVIVAAFSGAAALSGCAVFNGPSGAPDAANGGNGASKTVDTSVADSAMGYKNIEWKTPFWERGSSDKGTSAQGGANTTSVQGLQPKVGVYVDSRNGGSAADYRLVDALERHASSNGVILVPPDMLDEAINQSTACPSGKPTTCPGLLAIYPGIRLLIVVQPQENAGGNSTLTLQTRMIDTDFNITYKPLTMHLDMQGSGAKSDNSDIAVWSRRVLALARQRAEIAPWFAHSFSASNGDVYIDAGPRSGLAVNSVLQVHQSGKAVRAPGGQIVGWKPGPVAGKLKVKKFIGPHISVAEVISGQKPKPQDWLTLKGQ